MADADADLTPFDGDGSLDPTDADAIAEALSGFRKIATDIRGIVIGVKKDMRRDRHRNMAGFLAITLAVSIGGWNIYEDKQADHHRCQDSNESRAQIKGVWDRFLHILVPDPAKASPTARAGLAEMNSVLENAYRQRVC